MVNLNGTLISKDQNLFRAGNRAFLYGDQLFETIRFQKGGLLFWEDHYFRMMGAACMLRMEIPIHLNMDFIEEEILKTIENNNLSDKKARVRLSLFRADGGLYKPTYRVLEYLIEVKELETNLLNINTQGLVIDVFHDHLKPIQPLSNIKGGNSLVSVLSAIYADENNLSEAIILNENSLICETTASNIFIVKDKVIYTPPITSACVEGIVRNKILQHCSVWGYTVKEKEMKSFELIRADEVFLTNSIKGIQWVEAYKNKKYQNEISSDILNRLNELSNFS